MSALGTVDSGWDFPVAGAVDIGGVGSFTLINSGCMLPDSRNAVAVRNAQGGRRILVDGGGARPSNPDIAKLLAESTDHDVADAVSGLDMALVFAGSEISPVVEQTLLEKNIRSMGLATLPVDIDAQARSQIAVAGTPEPGQHEHYALPITHEAIQQAIADNATVGHLLNNRPGAFVLWLCRGCVLVNNVLGFKADDISTMVNPQGYSALGWGSASGANRAEIAAREALDHLLLGERRLQEASRVLISITASRQTLRLSECTFIMSHFRNHLVPGALYIFGATRELDGSDEARVSVLATGRQPARY